MYMLFYQMSRMCREKGAVKHDDRIDCVRSRRYSTYTDAMGISALGSNQRIVNVMEWNADD